LPGEFDWAVLAIEPEGPARHRRLVDIRSEVFDLVAAVVHLLVSY
jgi:hypothetical protein